MQSSGRNGRSNSVIISPGCHVPNEYIPHKIIYPIKEMEYRDLIENRDDVSLKAGQFERGVVGLYRLCE